MTRQQKKIGLAALLAVALLVAASWWAGQWHYHLTPGNNQVFREDSNAGAMAGFLVFIAAAIPALAALLGIHDRKFHEAARAGRVCAIIIGPYLAALMLVSLSNPGTIVNIGDSYCYDLWCLGVQQVNAREVNATPSGQDILYTADVRIFVDSTHPHHVPADQAKDFFYVLDDRGRRYPLQDTSFADADITVEPGESVKSSLSFLAPANARKLYLMGNSGEHWPYLPWVYLYFGSDVSLFHKPALVRIL